MNSKQFEEALKRAGYYEDFCSRIEEIVSQRNCNEYQARLQASKEYRQAAETARNIEQREKRASKGGASQGNNSNQSSAAPLPQVDEALFEGRRTTEAENIRWVADNLASEKPNLDEAPSKTAVALLSDCQQFPQFRVDFWKNMYTKLISKEQLADGDKDDEQYDGKPTVDTLEQIRQMREKAENHATR